jgi:hypothetical protein
MEALRTFAAIVGVLWVLALIARWRQLKKIEAEQNFRSVEDDIAKKALENDSTPIDDLVDRENKRFSGRFYKRRGDN